VVGRMPRVNSAENGTGGGDVPLAGKIGLAYAACVCFGYFEAEALRSCTAAGGAGFFFLTWYVWIPLLLLGALILWAGLSVITLALGRSRLGSAAKRALRNRWTLRGAPILGFVVFVVHYVTTAPAIIQCYY
jgi:hypothetical protein